MKTNDLWLNVKGYSIYPLLENNFEFRLKQSTIDLNLNKILNV